MWGPVEAMPLKLIASNPNIVASLRLAVPRDHVAEQYLETRSPFHPYIHLSIRFRLVNANQILCGKGFEYRASNQRSSLGSDLQTHSESGTGCVP